MSNSPAPLVPYWRLSTFYFFYFGLLGAWLPFWPLYLQAHHYSAQEIGYLAGVIMATKIFAPNVWGWLADHYGHRMLIIRIGALCSGFIFCAIFLSDSFLKIACVVAGYSFFWNAILAQFEVVTLSHLHGRPERYSRIRLWGSIGFILAVVVLGWFFDVFDIDWLPVVLLIILIGLWFSSLLVEERPSCHEDADRPPSIKAIIKQPSVIAFFLCCFLLQLSHGPYYTFFSLYLTDHGYSTTSIGLLWSLGVLAEVIIFLIMHSLILRFSLRHIMLVSLLLSAVRWLLIGFCPDSLGVLLVAQCLHAASFGTFHAFAVEMVRRLFKGGVEGQGMALYSSVSFGAGGAVGAVISGWVWDFSPLYTFVGAACICMLAFVIGLKVQVKPSGSLVSN